MTIKILRLQLGLSGTFIDLIDRLSDVSIDDLDLSVRAYNILKDKRISTVFDLVCADKDSLRQHANMQKKDNV